MNIIAKCLLIAFIAFASIAEAVTIVENGTTDYVIVLAEKASPSEAWAASELVDHIETISGAKLAIATAPASIPAKAIVLGVGPARSAGVEIDTETLGPDGFVIKTVDERVVIAGSPQRGTMYGVFDLLERIGCRWWAVGESTIPKTRTIDIGRIDDTQTPALEYRDFTYGEADNREAAQIWRARNRVNGGFYKDNAPKYGGTWRFFGLVHTYSLLLPKSKYFADHPEYYALVRGKRNTGQVCFTNDEVVKLIAEAVKVKIAENPDYKHFTVGQDDNNNYCRCDECKALAEKYTEPSGAQLDFAKRVAAIVRETYPDTTINVPAYRWSRQTPKGIVPDENMIISLCSIECNFGQPLAEGYPNKNADFKADIENWSAIAPKLYIWDYTTNFTHYVMPYPNYYVLADNVKFYADHNVRGIMHQGSHTTPNGQFAPLSMWVLAKAMWNPNVDGRELVREFISGYYGPKAGPFVQEYVDLLHESLMANRTPLWCTRGTYLNAEYLTPEVVGKSEALFAEALAAVADEPELLKRVRIAHFPMQYVVVQRPHKLWPTVKAALPEANLADYCRQFAATGRLAKINRVAEHDSAEPLFKWAEDYATVVGEDLNADLPAELAGADPTAYHMLQAAQMDQKVRFLTPAEGALDGWAMKIISHGWTIQHHLAPPLDMKANAKYKMFIRARATPSEGATGPVFSAGLHVPGGKRTSRAITAEEIDGTWQTYELGELTATENGGNFYIALDSKGKKFVKDVQLDCLWITAQP